MLAEPRLAVGIGGENLVHQILVAHLRLEPDLRQKLVHQPGALGRRRLSVKIAVGPTLRHDRTANYGKIVGELAEHKCAVPVGPEVPQQFKQCVHLR